jgi:two-component system phosphate regulon response regulator OmpR
VSKETVLLVDDDDHIRTVISHYLEEKGYFVLEASNAQKAEDICEGKNVDILLLDLTLPDKEGLDLISVFRAKGDPGIIILSGKSDTTEKIVSLEVGADDYMTKPIEMRELAARMKALRRRAHKHDALLSQTDTHNPDKIIFNDWVLDRTQYQLFEPSGSCADLTTGEFKLLEALVMSPNRALSRERLFDLTREGDYDIYDRAIDIQIARLRKKLHDDPKSPQIIKTVRGVGYMFCGETRNI